MNASFDQLSGGDRAQIAYSLSPMAPPSGKSLVLIVVTFFLLTGATLFVALRALVRLLTRNAGPQEGSVWGHDDSLVVLGFITLIPVTIYTVLSALYGVGKHDDELNQLIKLRALEYHFYWQICITFTILFARCTVVVTLLNRTKGSHLVPQLWFIFALSAGVFIWDIANDIATCDPIAATWNPALGTCSQDRFLAGSSGMFVGSAISSAIDISLVVIAWRVLRRFEFSRKAKWALGVLFVFAIYASIAPLARFPSFDAYATSHEQLYKLHGIMIWSNIEGAVALMVISVPSLARISMGYFGERSGGLVRKHKRGAHETNTGDPIQDTIAFYHSERLFVGDGDMLKMTTRSR
ncbi:hypothetical protein PG999_013597 [Apiospora kogelbergensis]|uniref:Rhodopsin domain-containing protein n=1 Tax=Apiospora kogelbergensis TaxID=1337665 RepID=A0AAW0QFV1_9PEZI